MHINELNEIMKSMPLLLIENELLIACKLTLNLAVMVNMLYSLVRNCRNPVSFVMYKFYGGVPTTTLSVKKM